MSVKVQLVYNTNGTFKPEVKRYVVLGESSHIQDPIFLSQGLQAFMDTDVSVLTKEFDNNKAKVVNGHALYGEDSVEVSINKISENRTRNSAAIRSDLIHSQILSLVNFKLEADVQVVFVVESNQVFASACAVARAFPTYSRKASFHKKSERKVYVSFITTSGQPLSEVNDLELQTLADNIRYAAHLTDMPCSELNTETYMEQVELSVSELPAEVKEKITTTIIKGKELDERGFGGLWGVGKAAANLPALVSLTFTPESFQPDGDSKTIALIGKGIVYDTGGLSLKSTTNMPTMKTDMGGSAAVLGAFLSLAKLGTHHRIHAILCLAENAVNNAATRPDDILTMYSGLTVEVNNTDAEGRLVLGDGVAYASKDLEGVTHIIDIATLTGAQIISTGPRHAGFMVNKFEFEQAVKVAAYRSGDLAFPLLYSPEFLVKELDSEVADLKNSNKNGPTTAASSLAGHFIEQHILPEFDGVWCHIDMAGPGSKQYRATGYGVALLYQLVNEIKDNEN